MSSFLATQNTANLSARNALSQKSKTLKNSLYDSIVSERSRESVITVWEQVFDNPPPKGLSQSLMAYILAFEHQSQTHGGLDHQTKAALKATQKKLSLKSTDKNPSRPSRKNAKFQTGTRLLREWNGVTHIVDVDEAGFIWQGKIYKSLSPIAKAITGAHWSGPRFFGLNPKTRAANA